jgi:hypothetical protein
MATLTQRARKSAQRTNWPAMLAVLVVGLMASIALAVGLATNRNTRTVVKEREVAGPPCVVAGSQACKRLAEQIAATCPGALCKKTVARALAGKTTRERRAAAQAIGAGLAAAGIRGSIQNPTAKPKPTPAQRRQQARERIKAQPHPNRSKAPAVVTPTPAGEPASTPQQSSPSAPSTPGRGNPAPSRSDPTPSLPAPSVPDTPKVPDVPAVSVPSVPPEVPVVPPVTVPEVPIPPLPVPDPLPGVAKRPECGVPVVHPCKPVK